jgi:hypothetical protein
MNELRGEAHEVSAAAFNQMTAGSTPAAPAI